MSKLIACNLVPLDGFFSGPGWDLSAMPFDIGFSDYNGKRIRADDTLLLVRIQFEPSQSYWPPLAEDVNQPAVEREFSRLNTVIEKVVVSNTLKPSKDEGWGPSRVVRCASAHAGEFKHSSGRGDAV